MSIVYSPFLPFPSIPWGRRRWALDRSYTVSTCREEVMARSGTPGSSSRNAAERVLAYSYQAQETRELVIADLLYALKKWVAVCR